MKPIDEMNEDELWEEFSNSLIRDSAAPMTMNYDDSESIRKNGIRECVNRWRYRLQKNHCHDAISRAYAIKLLEDRFLELQKIKKIPGNEKQEDVQLGINWCINTIREMDGVVATTPVAVVKIDKSDIKDLVDKKFNEFIESIDAVQVVRCKNCKHWEPTDEIVGICKEQMIMHEYDGGVFHLYPEHEDNYFCAYGEEKDE